ncbi:DUF167 domain-containing protein [Tsuneonella suprasediminis]|uniref:UPF0235 protein D6858_14510 n=1 Tax=Tsuneonella suprasediminis TaxID=2306996 RepID=A0A419QXY6_9SPHN|nr:DUF167 domain-containing protein [Tsuneonella suprasediminis]RJX65523.1 DUF167 domain-containing protein [Tsuneonella suprasediminis]
MARPKADYPDPAAIRALADGEGRLALRVTPGARSEGIELGDGKLQVKVRAKPTDGAANDAVIRMLAKALGTPPSGIELLRGATSREKLVRIGG